MKSPWGGRGGRRDFEVKWKGPKCLHITGKHDEKMMQRVQRMQMVERK
jgi:hypothetical protein